MSASRAEMTFPEGSASWPELTPPEVPTWHKTNSGSAVGVLHPGCDYLAAFSHEGVWHCNKCGALGMNEEVVDG